MGSMIANCSMTFSISSVTIAFDYCVFDFSISFSVSCQKKEEEKKNKMPVTIQYLRSIARTKMNPKWRSTSHPFQLYTKFRRAINFSVWNSLNANLHIPKTENIRRNCWRVRQNIICMFLLTRTRAPVQMMHSRVSVAAVRLFITRQTEFEIKIGDFAH